jgi:hypothetical protein
MKHDFCLCEVVTEDADSASVDMQEYKEVAFYATVGASAETLSAELSLSIGLEHSDNNSDFTACTDAQVLGAVASEGTGIFAIIDAATKDEKVYVAQYRGTKRYVRASITAGGTHTNGTPVAITALRWLSNFSPVN